MRNVYLSFLGRGTRQPDGSYSYNSTVYELNGIKSSETRHVQVAELEILQAKEFDAIIIVDTEVSHTAHYANLEKELHRLGRRNIFPLTIDEEMSPEGQWKWFEKILNCIEPDDRITIDLTHGFRSVPLVFSTALNFLQKARNIQLGAVYYGVYEKVDELGHAPIIDMKDFYTVNEWADAVNRLVEDADAGKMAHVAERSPDFQFSDLTDKKIISALQGLTDTIKNVDVNNVSKAAADTISLIREKEKTSSEPGRMLLKLIIDKFVSLSTETPAGNRYDRNYFRIQIELIRLLLVHRLFMQAYTVMREFIASIGMIGFDRESMSNKKRKKRRQMHAEIFVRMLQNEEDKWNFDGREDILAGIMPYYQELKLHGIEKKLRCITKTLVDYRNGFDHAWTCKSKAYEDIEKKGFEFLSDLENILASLEKQQFLLDH